MILTDLKSYLSQHQEAPIGDLVNRFGIEPDAIRAMLGHWMRKGRVRRIESDAGDCGGCTKCDAYRLEIYRWIG